MNCNAYLQGREAWAARSLVSAAPSWSAFWLREFPDVENPDQTHGARVGLRLRVMAVYARHRGRLLFLLLGFLRALNCFSLLSSVIAHCKLCISRLLKRESFFYLFPFSFPALSFEFSVSVCLEPVPWSRRRFRRAVVLASVGFSDCTAAVQH